MTDSTPDTAGSAGQDRVTDSAASSLLDVLRDAADAYRALPEWQKPICDAPWFAGRQEDSNG